MTLSRTRTVILLAGAAAVLLTAALAHADSIPFEPQFDFNINDTAVSASGSVPGLPATGFNVHEDIDSPFPLPFPLCQLVVKKVVVGGSAKPEDFLIHVEKNGVEISGSPAPGSSSGTVYDNLKGDDYTIRESGGPPGYETHFSGDCDEHGKLHLSPTGFVKCTITNVFKSAPPVVVPSVVTSSLEAKVISVATSSVVGSVVTPPSLVGEVIPGNVITGTVTPPPSGGGGGGGGGAPSPSGGGGPPPSGGGGAPTPPSGGGPTTTPPGIPSAGEQPEALPGIPNAGEGGGATTAALTLVLSALVVIVGTRSLLRPLA